MSGKNGEISEEQGFGDETRKFEISARLHFVSEAGIKPFALIAWGPRESFRRLFVSIHLALRNELRILPIESTQNFPAISYEEQAFLFVIAAGTVRIWVSRNLASMP